LPEKSKAGARADLSGQRQPHRKSVRDLSADQIKAIEKTSVGSSNSIVETLGVENGVGWGTSIGKN